MLCYIICFFFFQIMHCIVITQCSEENLKLYKQIIDQNHHVKLQIWSKETKLSPLLWIWMKGNIKLHVVDVKNYINEKYIRSRLWSYARSDKWVKLMVLLCVNNREIRFLSDSTHCWDSFILYYVIDFSNKIDKIIVQNTKEFSKLFFLTPHTFVQSFIWGTKLGKLYRSIFSWS